MVDGRTSLTFAEAYQGTLALASRLSAMGVGKGDRVGVLMSRSYKQALAQLGAMAADAVMVPISDLLKPAQVRHVLDNCGARAVIVDSDKLDRLGSSAAGMAVLVSNGAGQGHSTVESVLEGGLVNVEPSIIGSDSAAIIYTSGSTGLPKGMASTVQKKYLA